MVNFYAYDAGYADGRKWVEPEKVGREFHAVTIESTGAAAFGVRCGLTDNEVNHRGKHWDEACREYDRGCVEGINSKRAPSKPLNTSHRFL